MKYNEKSFAFVSQGDEKCLLCLRHREMEITVLLGVRVDLAVRDCRYLFIDFQINVAFYRNGKQQLRSEKRSKARYE